MMKRKKLRKGRKSMTVAEWADELGIAESTIRARMARGEDPLRPRQMTHPKITPRMRYDIRRAKGTIQQISEKYGVSRVTVMKIRNSEED